MKFPLTLLFCPGAENTWYCERGKNWACWQERWDCPRHSSTFQVEIKGWQSKVAETGNTLNWKLLHLSLWLHVETFLMQAFPVGETAASGAAISRKYQVDAAIMSTIILDLQPFNQVNRWKTSFRWQSQADKLLQGRFSISGWGSGSIFHLELWRLLQRSTFQGIDDEKPIACSTLKCSDLHQG